MKRSSPAIEPQAMPESTAARLVELGSCIEFLEKIGRLVCVHSAVSTTFSGSENEADTTRGEFMSCGSIGA